MITFFFLLIYTSIGQRRILRVLNKKGFTKGIKIGQLSSFPCTNCIRLRESVKYFLPAKKAWENQMPDIEIKRLMKNLGESINEALADSPKINERIQEIRDAGYEVFLIIEAKIGFSRKGKEDSDTEFNSAEGPVRLHITHEDAKFLKSLKISIDDHD
jgi:hypothetical protein